MNYNPENPLIIQSDLTVLVEVIAPKYEEARDELVRFAELEKSPEHMHTYRINPLSLWNAAAAGVTTDQIITALETYSKYEIPQNVGVEIRESMDRYGKVHLDKEDDALILSSEDALIITEICRHKIIQPYIEKQLDAHRVRVSPLYRGHLKQALTRIGFPVKDRAGYIKGSTLKLHSRDMALSGNPFALRDYQKEAVDIFHAGGGPDGGSGTVVLPCGAGKTIVGISAIETLQCETLILTTNITASRQWKAELIDKTSLTDDQIGEY
ncbi:MAG: helicase-associated domain-containing protein, partial [Candidatus Latescibacteria bacterium]|nr:helicase-associated domain-containing protein [Candidatus Latescibacterota bacterium]